MGWIFFDEYYQISPDNPQSYNYYMRNNFFNRVNVDPKKIYIPDGMTDDVDLECQQYEKKIRRAGGIDLQVLGIGPNGHIGFNEPAEKLYVETHLVNLRKETIEANSRFFDCPEEMPRQAISIGIATILKADIIILLASGKNKARAIKKTISGYVDTKVPASLLQTHPGVILIIDREAAQLL